MVKANIANNLLFPIVIYRNRLLLFNALFIK